MSKSDCLISQNAVSNPAESRYNEVVSSDLPYEGSIELFIKLVEFVLIKEPSGLIQTMISRSSLNFYFRNIGNRWVQDFLLKLFCSTDRFLNLNNFIQGHIYLKLMELNVFETLFKCILGNFEVDLFPVFQVPSGVHLDNFNDNLVGIESKYNNVFHSSVDQKNFAFEIVPDISRYDIDLLADIVTKKNKGATYANLEASKKKKLSDRLKKSVTRVIENNKEEKESEKGSTKFERGLDFASVSIGIPAKRGSKNPKKKLGIFIDLKRIENVTDDDERMKFQIVEQSRRMAMRKKAMTSKANSRKKVIEVWNNRSIVSRLKLGQSKFFLLSLVKTAFGYNPIKNTFKKITDTFIKRRDDESKHLIYRQIKGKTPFGKLLKEHNMKYMRKKSKLVPANQSPSRRSLHVSTPGGRVSRQLAAARKSRGGSPTAGERFTDSPNNLRPPRSQFNWKNRKKPSIQVIQEVEEDSQSKNSHRMTLDITGRIKRQRSNLHASQNQAGVKPKLSRTRTPIRPGHYRRRSMRPSEDNSLPSIDKKSSMISSKSRQNSRSPKMFKKNALSPNKPEDQEKTKKERRRRSKGKVETKNPSNNKKELSGSKSKQRSQRSQRKSRSSSRSNHSSSVSKSSLKRKSNFYKSSKLSMRRNFLRKLGKFLVISGAINKDTMKQDEQKIERKNSEDYEAFEKSLEKVQLGRRRSLIIKENFSMVMRYKEELQGRRQGGSGSKGKILKRRRSINKQKISNERRVGRFLPSIRQLKLGAKKDANKYIQMFTIMLKKLIPEKLDPIVINMIDVVNNEVLVKFKVSTKIQNHLDLDWPSYSHWLNHKLRY